MVAHNEQEAQRLPDEVIRKIIHEFLLPVLSKSKVVQMQALSHYWYGYIAMKSDELNLTIITTEGRILQKLATLPPQVRNEDAATMHKKLKTLTCADFEKYWRKVVKDSPLFDTASTEFAEWTDKSGCLCKGMRKKLDLKVAHGIVQESSWFGVDEATYKNGKLFGLRRLISVIGVSFVEI